MAARWDTHIEALVAEIRASLTTVAALLIFDSGLCEDARFVFGGQCVTSFVVRPSQHLRRGRSVLSTRRYVHPALRQNAPGLEVDVRDVQSPPLPHLDAATFLAFSKPARRTHARRDRPAALSDEFIGELEAATDLLIAMPLYNFGVPSAFKAWIDHVTRAQRTFRVGARGAEGMLDHLEALLGDRRAGRSVPGHAA